jgi:drug/metabolite transporter (DMT)-like permease
VLISRPERSHGRPKGIGLAMLAGCGFGLFFIIISRVSPHAVFWPLALARLVSVLILLLLALFRKQPIKPQKKLMPLMMLSGTMDALGNAFFVLAAHSGRLDIASVLSSLYPAATVILAAVILRERVTRIQGLGILLALVAIPLISV